MSRGPYLLRLRTAMSGVPETTTGPTLLRRRAVQHPSALHTTKREPAALVRLLARREPSSTIVNHGTHRHSEWPGSTRDRGNTIRWSPSCGRGSRRHISPSRRMGSQGRPSTTRLLDQRLHLHRHSVRILSPSGAKKEKVGATM